MTDALLVFGGFGLGLRTRHYGEILASPPPVDFFEAISENYMVDGGRPLWTLEQLRRDYPVMLHGVSMSLGAVDGLDRDYLHRLRALADRIEPLWLSDHLCWTGTGGVNTHDLLPLPLTDEALDVVCRNIAVAQEALGRNLLVENPSSYVTFAEDAYSEWGFLSEVCRRTGCGLLLDVNNVFVSANNHGFDAMDYLNGLPLDRVRQIHLAGHEPGEGGLLIDTHDADVCDEVWALYETVMARLGPVAVMIERDDNIPPLAELLAELDRARRVRVAA